MASDKPAESVEATLAKLESEFLQYSLQEQMDIAMLREGLRKLHKRYGACATLAMMATNYEIHLKGGAK